MRQSALRNWKFSGKKLVLSISFLHYLCIFYFFTCQILFPLPHPPSNCTTSHSPSLPFSTWGCSHPYPHLSISFKYINKKYTRNTYSTCLYVIAPDQTLKYYNENREKYENLVLFIEEELNILTLFVHSWDIARYKCIKDA